MKPESLLDKREGKCEDKQMTTLSKDLFVRA